MALALRTSLPAVDHRHKIYGTRASMRPLAGRRTALSLRQDGGTSSDSRQESGLLGGFAATAQLAVGFLVDWLDSRVDR